MSSDPLLKAAIAHWGPRFVANGVVLTDFEEVTGSLSSLQRLVPRLVGARRASRAARPRGAGAKAFPHRRRMPAARRRLLSFRLVSVRARRRADEGRAQEADRMPPGGAAAPAAARRARRNPVPGQDARRHSAQAGRRRAAAGGGDGGRARLDQGRNRRLRSAVPGARHRDSGVRGAGPGRGAIRFRRSAAITRCR